jgi:phosphoribosylaminoimidazolecarboxamide formyltransferase / IMP cyclohydrolase
MSKNAIISVSDKSNIEKLSAFLLKNDYTIYSTGGTYRVLTESNPNYVSKIIQISDLTGFPEILDGRVKTLHPKIYGGLLANLDIQSHKEQLEKHSIPIFSLLVVNLYPFEQKNSIENIDIGGVSLIRAASKNYNHVTVLTNPNDYDEFQNFYPNTTLDYRKVLAAKGFTHTSHYDSLIHRFLNDKTVELKYGMNPHQKPASVSCLSNNKDAFEVINGTLGYINVLDFIHGWLTVYEIGRATGKVTYISMKHTSPAGLAIGTNVSEDMLSIFGIPEELQNELTEGARAFIKCRNCDPLSSFGDFICCNSIVDEVTAKLIKREVCDGIAALGFTDSALEILKSKKGGKFIIIKMNEDYCEQMLKTGWTESKEMYGLKLSQPSNNWICNREDFDSDDAVIAYCVLKYSQSNNVSMVYDGQLLGLGCGQQNRVACVKLAGEKANIWKLRHHPEVIEYYKGLDTTMKRQEKINSVYDYIKRYYSRLSYNCPNINITLGSDGFFPFTDNIIEAHKFGVTNILQPGGSIMDEKVEEKCRELNITMKNVGTRMFYH